MPKMTKAEALVILEDAFKYSHQNKPFREKYRIALSIIRNALAEPPLVWEGRLRDGLRWLYTIRERMTFTGQDIQQFESFAESLHATLDRLAQVKVKVSREWIEGQSYHLEWHDKDELRNELIPALLREFGYEVEEEKP